MNTPRVRIALVAAALMMMSCNDGAAPAATMGPTTAAPGTTTDVRPPSSTTAPSTATTRRADTVTTVSAPTTTDSAATRAGVLYSISFSALTTGVVAVSPSDGSILREVTGDIGEGAGALDYSPTRDSLFFSRVVTAARSEVVEIPVAGDGGPTVVTTGYAVDVTDSGDRMAVARRELIEGGGRRIVLEIRDLDGEVSASWSEEHPAEEPVFIRHLAWSPDGSLLAFEKTFEDGSAVFLLDPASDAATIRGAARRLPTPSEEDGVMRSSPFWLDDGRLGAVAACCSLPVFETWELVVIDPDTGSRRGTLLAVDRPVVEVDVRAGGERIAVITSHHSPGSREETGPRRLMVWTPDDGVRELGEELVSAAW